MVSTREQITSERVSALQDRIVACNVDPSAIKIVGVSKGFGAERVDEVARAGINTFSENYAQEALAKWPDVTEEIEHHWTGALQTNKVAKLAKWVDVWQTVDREDVVPLIARHAPNARVLLQVNTSGEQQKNGCHPLELPILLHTAREAGLEIEGLMTIAVANNEAATRKAFEKLRELRDQYLLRELSMGMSNDLELALAEGATWLRIGSALFGSRV